MTAIMVAGGRETVEVTFTRRLTHEALAVGIGRCGDQEVAVGIDKRTWEMIGFARALGADEYGCTVETWRIIESREAT